MAGRCLRMLGSPSALRASAKVPLELANLASRGAIRRYLDSHTDEAAAEAVREADEFLEHHLAEKTSFVSRAVASLELQLSADVNPYLDALLENFDAAWQSRHKVSDDES